MSNYSEGAWTPALTFGGLNTGPITYTTQFGSYTIIGRLAFCTFFINLSSKGSAVGNAAVTGFPVGSAAASAGNWITFVETGLLTYDANYTSITIQPSGNNSTIFNLNQTGSGQNKINLTDANFANNSYLASTVIYAF